jgi:hypothetical protein
MNPVFCTNEKTPKRRNSNIHFRKFPKKEGENPKIDIFRNPRKKS